MIFKLFQSVKPIIAKIIGFIFSFLTQPHQCLLCHVNIYQVHQVHQALCSNCKIEIQKIKSELPLPYFSKLKFEQKQFKQNQENNEYILTIISSWFSQYKNPPNLLLTKALADILHLFWKEQEHVFYVFVPVPIHHVKLNQTGFHHVYEIVKLFIQLEKAKINKKTDVFTILNLNLLEKIRYNTQHKSSNIQERQLAIKGLYQMIDEKSLKKLIQKLQKRIFELQKLNPNKITQIQWIIFDDIATSGLTTQECLKVLQTELSNYQEFQNWCQTNNVTNDHKIITLGQTELITSSKPLKFMIE